MAPLLSRLGNGGGTTAGFGFGRRRGSGPTGPFSATGGNVDALAPGNGYKYHTFTSPGTFTVSNPGSVEILLVGAGGPGGSSGGGGGGGGGVVHVTNMSVSAGSYPVSIGPGYGGYNRSTSLWDRTNSPPYSSPTQQPTGGPTTFGINPSSTYLVANGGGGGTPMDGSQRPGGSGGGGSRNNVAGGAATQPTANPGFSNGTITQYGNAGGPSSAGFFPGGGAGGGGGGGAGGAGTGSSGPGNGSDAGIGVQFPQFTGPLIGVPSLAPLSGYFGGGGGGGNDGKDVSGGLGGGGNGGRGAPNFGPNNPGGNGVNNSGGGGGGAGSGPGDSGSSGGGGSGIIIIRYLA